MNENNNKVDIEGFISKHLVKVFYGIVVYFLLQISTDFKEMKTAIQQLVVNQAIIENRVNTLEANDKRQDAKFEAYDKSVQDFYKSYKLTAK